MLGERDLGSANLRHIKDLTLRDFVWDRKMHLCRIRDLMIILLMESKHRTRIQRQQCLQVSYLSNKRLRSESDIFEIIDGDVGFREDGPGGIFRGVGI